MTNGIVQQIAILVGGKGTRLGSLASEIPKPLLPITGEHRFLDYLIEMVSRHGYRDILLLAGHLGEQVELLYRDRKIGDTTITVLCEPEPRGTAGALVTARDLLQDRFILMNGDAFFDINLRALEVCSRGNQALATLALRSMDDVSRYGLVETNGERITSFLEKEPGNYAAGIVNGGIYVLDRAVLDLIDRLPWSIEQDLFPRLVERGMICGNVFVGYFVDIGLPEELARAQRELPRVRTRPAAFLDRDGVLNLDHGYTFRPGDLEFIPGAIEAVRLLNDSGYFVIVVSNQAGIARGYFTMDDAQRFNQEMQERLFSHGAHIDQFYLAPYHPDGAVTEYAVDHFDRKPNPGMLLRAFAEWPIDKDRSFLIGDKQTDVMAAQGAGVTAYMYEGGDLRRSVASALARSEKPGSIEY